jgi:hypothetical protein
MQSRALVAHLLQAISGCKYVSYALRTWLIGTPRDEARSVPEDNPK